MLVHWPRLVADFSGHFEPTLHFMPLVRSLFFTLLLPGTVMVLITLLGRRLAC
jgi:hypothetical protein